jgi:hypothetical protein
MDADGSRDESQAFARCRKSIYELMGHKWAESKQVPGRLGQIRIGWTKKIRNFVSLLIGILHCLLTPLPTCLASLSLSHIRLPKNFADV